MITNPKTFFEQFQNFIEESGLQLKKFKSNLSNYFTKSEAIDTFLGKTDKAESAKTADTATTSVTATKATQDASGNIITSTYATKAEVTQGLAGKAPKSHTHTIANVTGLQADLTTIRESITNVSSKVDGIGDTLSPTYAKKQGILDACDKALNGANLVHAGDPTLDEIKLALATIQAQLGQLESRRYVKETGKSSDGTSWYRKWSDGWIEQGGITQSTRGGTSRTIELRTSFSSSNYFVVVQSYTGGSPAPQNNYSHVVKKGLDSFSTIADCTEDIVGLWYACGY